MLGHWLGAKYIRNREIQKDFAIFEFSRVRSVPPMMVSSNRTRKNFKFFCWLDIKCPNACDILYEMRKILEDGLKNAVEQKTVGSIGSVGCTAERKSLPELLKVFRRDASGRS